MFYDQLTGYLGLSSFGKSKKLDFLNFCEFYIYFFLLVRINTKRDYKTSEAGCGIMRQDRLQPADQQALQ